MRPKSSGQGDALSLYCSEGWFCLEQSEITITSQEIFAVRDFQRLLHQNRSEREGDTRRTRGPVPFTTLCWLCVIITGFHLRTWGPGGLRPFQPNVWEKWWPAMATRSDTYRLWQTGCNRVCRKLSFPEPHTRPPLPQTTRHLNLAFSHQVLGLSQAWVRQRRGEGQTHRPLGNWTQFCWVCWALGLSVMRKVPRKTCRFVSLAFLSLTHPGSKESFSRWNFNQWCLAC